MFATYPNEDYDRRNEDVDPMAASAEYELEKRVERLDLFPVELEKGRNTLYQRCTNTFYTPYYIILLKYCLVAIFGHVRGSCVRNKKKI